MQPAVASIQSVVPAVPTRHDSNIDHCKLPRCTCTNAVLCFATLNSLKGALMVAAASLQCGESRQRVHIVRRQFQGLVPEPPRKCDAPLLGLDGDNSNGGPSIVCSRLREWT